MQVLISWLAPIALLTAVPHQQETVVPRHHIGIAARENVVGNLRIVNRLVVTSGSETWPFSLRVTQQMRRAARAWRWSESALRASLSGVDNGRARRFNGLRQFYRLAKVPPPSTRSSIDNR